MKKYFYLIFLLCNSNIYGQITSPIVKANFGVDGDMRANFFKKTAVDTVGSEEDWFNYDSSTTGIGIIDTTGAAAIVAGYSISPASRNYTFMRYLSIPPFSTVNNKLLLDAVYVRDFHATDSTMFASGASTNGMSPGSWQCPPAQSVPDKNDILEMMAHVRRDGPDNKDSLWMFGAVAIENTKGDRYFDFEMFQSNLSFDKSTNTFSGYGPDAGHTTWKFNSDGDIVTAGDIVFSADYGSAELTSIEARIWIDRSSLAIVPAGFDWSGTFDGEKNGAQYGYAGIKPKTAGAFYTGIESNSQTWAGPFSVVRGDNSVLTDYLPGQLMEFSVNLSKLGLDPFTVRGNSGCTMAFRKILVKTRASTSFTAQLKDFVSPVDFFQGSLPKIKSDVYEACGILGPSMLQITNPIPSSIYTWSTTDGHIVGDSVGNSIIIDSAGSYLVSQKLNTGCSTYSVKTVIIQPNNKTCAILQNDQTVFGGRLTDKLIQLNWSVVQNNKIKYFEIEKSTDGVNFTFSKTINSYSSELPVVTYNFYETNQQRTDVIYYRLKIISVENTVSYTKILSFSNKDFSNSEVRIIPNPVKETMQLNIFSSSSQNVHGAIYNAAGLLMRTFERDIKKGNSYLAFSDFQNWPTGVYIIKINLEHQFIVKKMLLKK